MIVTKRLSGILDCRFRLPTKVLRLRTLDNPELQLAALLVVATKLCFPFKGRQMPPAGELSGIELPFFDWGEWSSATRKRLDENKERDIADFKDMVPERVVSMGDEELDAYFAHVSSFIDKESESTSC